MELFQYPVKTPRVFHIETTPRKYDSTILRKKVCGVVCSNYFNLLYFVVNLT